MAFSQEPPDWTDEPERQGTSNAKESSDLWPEPIDFDELSTHEPEQPRFIIQDWMPAGYATLFAGHGGVGKSGIALHQAVCIALGRPFFGVECEQRNVMYLSCEDRKNVLHWRLSRICAYEQITLADLKGKLFLLDLVGKDTVLWMPPHGHTVAFAELEAKFKEHQCQMLYVDGISDTFAGNENSKVDVKRYVNKLISLIDPDDGGIILVGHVSKPSSTQGGQGDGYSGTTGWHNSVRARWYLYPERNSGGEDGSTATGDLLLDLQKSNLGPADQSLRFTWSPVHHMFLANIEKTDGFERKHQERTERDAILVCIAKCAVTGIRVPATVQGRKTGYHVLSEMPEFPKTLAGGARNVVARFNRLVMGMRHSNQIIVTTIKTDTRKLVEVLELAQENS